MIILYSNQFIIKSLERPFGKKSNYSHKC